MRIGAAKMQVIVVREEAQLVQVERGSDAVDVGRGPGSEVVELELAGAGGGERVLEKRSEGDGPRDHVVDVDSLVAVLGPREPHGDTVFVQDHRVSPVDGLAVDHVAHQVVAGRRRAGLGVRRHLELCEVTRQAADPVFTRRGARGGSCDDRDDRPAGRDADHGAPLHGGGRRDWLLQRDPGTRRGRHRHRDRVRRAATSHVVVMDRGRERRNERERKRECGLVRCVRRRRVQGESCRIGAAIHDARAAVGGGLRRVVGRPVAPGLRCVHRVHVPGVAEHRARVSRAGAGRCADRIVGRTARGVGWAAPSGARARGGRACACDHGEYDRPPDRWPSAPHD